ncbi:hypothetical protein HDU76_003585 [Blyttiomyces sp. JEL0837]|nr:hypothetical protein HDU76_003585 [Blyttiomyces sp. JEL0837]
MSIAGVTGKNGELGVSVYLQHKRIRFVANFTCEIAKTSIKVIANEAATPGNLNGNRVETDTVAPAVIMPAAPDMNLEVDELATVSWLSELHPTTQQTLFAKNANSNTNTNADVNTSSPTSKLAALQNNVQRQPETSDAKFTVEIEPSMQRFIYSDIIREGAPTSNINLENYLQRLHGSYSSWTHEFVMEWARLKGLDAAVVEILRNYRIDGPLLARLDVHSLKEKCDVQDFRLRAKFMQAVEFLKDRSQVIANSSGITDNEVLPQYEGGADNNV